MGIQSVTDVLREGEREGGKSRMKRCQQAIGLGINKQRERERHSLVSCALLSKTCLGSAWQTQGKGQIFPRSPEMGNKALIQSHFSVTTTL